MRVRSYIAGGLSFLVPGLGHTIINFNILTGMLIMIFYFSGLTILIQAGVAHLVIPILVPLIHFAAGISAFVAADSKSDR